MATTEKNTAAGSRRASNGEPTVIKKYANRRLYNTGTSSYVTLDYLSEMVKNGEEFVVFDAKTGDDITRSVLTQIIFEEENKGQNLLPIQFLRKLIQYYGDSMQSFVPSYLEMSMEAFSRNQERLREQMRETFGAAPGYTMFEETARANMAMFENAMKMFTPGALRELYGAGRREGAVESAGPAGDRSQEEIEMLREEIADLRRQLAMKGSSAAE
ncbi:MAG: polyhydroxyalkanoate synthesis repressor PhaR [Alphaproteobacteria bacterium]|nr:polyhydroxyalkanoate synthesis repressor PhaR [Alphaproteobacteria bacterium]